MTAHETLSETIVEGLFNNSTTKIFEAIERIYNVDINTDVSTLQEKKRILYYLKTDN